MKTITRRRALHGLGVCIGLPALEALQPARAAEQPGTGRSGAPLRTAFIFFPNGAIPKHWWPTGGTKDFRFGDTLAPLEPLRRDVQILGGLDHANAEAGNDGPGDHARGNSVFLTGVRLQKSPTELRAGVSIDQLLAQRFGQATRLPSLELTCDNVRRSSGCDSGYSCAYQYNVSWSSATTPCTPESSPRAVFERLFGEGAHGERAANAQRRMAARRSILDFALDEAQRMQRRLGHKDREKLDQYLTGLREVEGRIERAEAFGPNVDPDRPTPAGVPIVHGDYVDVMFDLLALAFQTDSTRVATFVLAHDGNNRSFADIGIAEGHHDLSHHQNNPDRIAKVAQIDRWYVERFAAFLSKLAAADDGAGRRLIDHCRIVFGSGNADGNRHTHDNLPVVLAGGGGGALTPGRYVRHGGKPLSSLWLTLAHQAGVADLTRFGDASAPLSDV